MSERWRIRKGDTVCVIAGKDKGKQGTIIKVDREARRVVVQGVNVVKRHKKPSAQTPGGLIEKELSLHASNVMLVDPVSGKPTRVGTQFLEDGRKVRFAKASGELIN